MKLAYKVLAILNFSLLQCLYSQSIDNVRFRQSDDDKVIVTYDITGGENQNFDVKLTVSDDGGANFLIVPRTVSGDVGPNVKGGHGKQIVWDVLSDIRRLEGERFVFKVLAKSKGGMTIAGMEFVFIPGGTFDMGDTFGDGEADEKPVHTVTVSDFYLGKTEVTVAQYRTFCNATGRSMPGAPGWGWQDNHPIVYVTWNDAVAFCQHANGRLPTEAEWEYAAREGGRKIIWSGTNSPSQLGDFAWYDVNSGSQTHWVASKLANALGLYDMSGNVWEWCQDWYGDNYYSQSPGINPQGWSFGANRVLRGGSWGSSITKSLRSSNRDTGNPGDRYNVNGFRVARSGE